MRRKSKERESGGCFVCIVLVLSAVITIYVFWPYMQSNAFNEFNRDTGNLQIDKPPSCTEKLYVVMKECMMTCDSSSCCTSVEYTCKSGDTHYANCLDSALTVYLHTTGAPTCCYKTEENPIPQMDAGATRYTVSGFVGEIEKEDMNQMCLIEMETDDGREFHFFSIELRATATKGFYTYSSWGMGFNLLWFLGNQTEVLIGDKKKLSLRPDHANQDKLSKALKDTCGNGKFLEIFQLRECLEKFSKLFTHGSEPNYLKKLYFKFTCKTLSEPFLQRHDSNIEIEMGGMGSMKKKMRVL